MVAFIRYHYYNELVFINAQALDKDPRITFLVTIIFGCSMYLITSILVTKRFKGRIMKIYWYMQILALIFDIINIIAESLVSQ